MMEQKINETVEYIKQYLEVEPEIALILGSGLGDLADEIESPIILNYEDIPNFPKSTVAGHKGRLIIGEIMGKCVVAMQGRVHFYEGYSMQEITFPVRIFKRIGVETLLVTNACGGLNPKLYPGALMLITDHINMMGDNPLIGKNLDSFGPRFPDMSRAYDAQLIGQTHELAKQLDIPLESGVYTAISGPYYFSRAELRMLQIIGGDTIGMSTVPEVIVAAHSGLKVLGISCVTDMSLPDTLEPLDHETVMAMAEKTKPKFIKLVKGIIKEVL
jgi:purine-nucleoside phosphorylase